MHTGDACGYLFHKLLTLKFINFQDLAYGLIMFATFHLVQSTIPQMALKQHVFNLRKSLLNRGCLRNDVNAVSILLNQVIKTADLTPNDFKASL